jgi:hypothetical protein
MEIQRDENIDLSCYVILHFTFGTLRTYLRFGVCPLLKNFSLISELQILKLYCHYAEALKKDTARRLNAKELHYNRHRRENLKPHILSVLIIN